jgi:phospholipid-binding lipoprotein MlaA
VLADGASRQSKTKHVPGTTLYAPGIGPAVQQPAVKAKAAPAAKPARLIAAKPARIAAPAKPAKPLFAKRTKEIKAPAATPSKPLQVKPASAQRTASTATNLRSGGTDALDDYGTTDSHVNDPMERMNRSIFRFNHGVYNYLFRPVSKGYTFVTPRPVRQGLDNFFDNLRFPVRFINCALQGKFRRAGLETQKFAVNTVGGIGGLIKQSDKIPALASVPPEDTGLTFANWGIGHGPYLVLPVLGASSFRDGFGLAGDYVLNPVNWGIFMHGKNARKWTWIPPTVDTIRALPLRLDLYDTASANAVDPYISVRDAYLQNRAAAARQ